MARDWFPVGDAQVEHERDRGASQVLAVIADLFIVYQGGRNARH
jgi:hypothetical protein